MDRDILHEQGKDFHYMVQPGIRTTSVSQGADQSLRDDSTDFTRSSRNTVSSRTVSCGEDFSRNDESSGVGTEILEEVAQTVESKKTAGGDDVETKSDDTEKNSEDKETTDLNGLAANGINGCNRNPITRDETGNRENEIANTGIV